MARTTKSEKCTPPSLPDKVIYNDGIVRVWHNYGNLNPPPGVPVEHAPIHFHVSVKGTSGEYKVFASGTNLSNSKSLPKAAIDVFTARKSKFTSIEKRIGKWYAYMKRKGCV